MSRSSRSSQSWEVRASALARNTHNLIRNIVDNLQVEPNPDKQLIALSVGDPTTFGNLNPPEQVLQAVRESIEWTKSRSYGAAVGHMEARAAVAVYSTHQGNVAPDDVILCSGCSHAIEMVIAVLADTGQNILVPRPGFMIYKTLAEGLGIEIKYYNLLPEKQWKVDLDDLESQVDNETALIVVINPSNPCGSVYNKEHLLEILDVASRNHVPILADEIYEHFVFTGHEYHAISSLSRDVPVLTCSGLTKRFLVPGWRMGWVIVHDRNNVLGNDIRRGLVNFAGRILGPSTLIQRALPSILANTPQTFFDEVLLFIESQAKLAYEELRLASGLHPIMPQGAMYMMIEIKMNMFPTFENELQFVERMVSEQSVFCLPGQEFNSIVPVNGVTVFHCDDSPMAPSSCLPASPLPPTGSPPPCHQPQLAVVGGAPPPLLQLAESHLPEDILREACYRIRVFCEEHIISEEKIKEIDTNIVSMTSGAQMICDTHISRAA